MKKILFIGAGFLQSFVIETAKSIGYSTYAVDSNPEAIGFQHTDQYAAIDIVDKEACLQFAGEHAIDGVMTAATDYGVMTTAYIAAALKLPGLSKNAAITVKNKFLTRNALFEVKADDSGPNYEISTAEHIKRVQNQVVYPVMVKPCDGSGSRGASKVADDAVFESACIEAINSSTTRRAVVEPFIEGIEYGVESFVYNSVPYVLTVMKKWMTQPPYYAELGHAIPSGLSEEMENKIINTTKKAITAMGITEGAVNMDVLVTAEETVHIVDVGARMGGNLIGSHIVPAGTGYAYMENLIKSAVGDTISVPHGERGIPVATRLLALTPGIVAELPDFDCIEAQYDVRILHNLEVGDKINTYRTNIDGCGYVVTTADSLLRASEKAAHALNVIDTAIKRI